MDGPQCADPARAQLDQVACRLVDPGPGPGAGNPACRIELSESAGAANPMS